MKRIRSMHLLLIVAGTILSIIAICLLRHSVLTYQYYFGMYHDDGLYLVSAKALAENLGYRILSLPGEPFQTKYPIAYPFLLSLLWRCWSDFPSNLMVFEVFQVICSTLAPVCMVAYLVSTRKATVNLGFAIAFATLLNVRFIDFAPMVMGDLVSALGIAMCMWCAESESRKGDGLKLLTGCLMAGTILLRGQTIVLMPAVLLYLALKRRFKMLLTTGLLSVFFIGAMWLWQAQHIVDVPPILYYYTSYFKHAVYTAPVWTFNMVAANAELSIVRAINTFIPGLEQISYQQLSPLQFVILYNIAYPAIFATFLLGVCRDALRRSLPALVCLTYILSLLMWPCRLEWRYVLPIMVLGYFYFFIGVRTVTRRMKPLLCKTSQHRRSFSKVCNGAAIAASVGLVLATASVSCGKVGWVNCLNNPPMPKTYRDSLQSFEWIKVNTSKDAVFICNNDPSLFLYTSRRAMMPSSLELWRFTQDRYVDADSLQAAIQFSKATYVMNDPAFRMMGFAYPQLAEAIAELNRRQPDSLRPVFKSSKGLVTIYSVSK